MPAGPSLNLVPRRSGASTSVHPSQTVNDGIKDGTDGGTHRPKSSHSSRSGPLHTDTPSVSVTASKGALTYRGAIDPTTTEPPADAALGDVYLASTGGMALESCSGVAG